MNNTPKWTKLDRVTSFYSKTVDTESRLPIIRLHTARSFSSAGRALPLQGRGHWFEPSNDHHTFY